MYSFRIAVVLRDEIEKEDLSSIRTLSNFLFTLLYSYLWLRVLLLLSIIANEAHSLQILKFVWHVMFLEHQWKRHIIATNTLDRCLQRQEAPFLQRCYNFSSKATRDGRLMTHNELPSLVDRLFNRTNVPRENGLQINEFSVNAVLFLSEVACLFEKAELPSPANYRNITPVAHYFGLSEREFVVTDWDFLDCGSIERLVFT